MTPEIASNTASLRGRWGHFLRPSPLALLMLLVFVVGTYATQSLPPDQPDHGDVFSDLYVIDGANRIAQYGLWDTRLALPTDDGLELGLDPYLYVNWPSAPYVVQSFGYQLGLSSNQVRMLPLLQVALAGYLAFCFARRFLGRSAALFALGFFLTASPVRMMADSLATVPPDLLGRIAAFSAVVIANEIDPAGPRRRWLLGLGTAAVVVGANGAFLGFESFPAACVFAFGYPLTKAFIRRGLTGPDIIASLAVPAGGVLLAVSVRIMQIAILPGPMGEDLDTVRSGAAFRVDDSSFIRVLGAEFLRLIRYTPALLVLSAVAVLIWLYRMARGTRLPRSMAIAGLFLGSELVWYLAVRQHSRIHIHTLLLVTYSLVFLSGWVFAVAFRAAHRLAPNWQIVGQVALLLLFPILLAHPLVDATKNVSIHEDISADIAEVAEVSGSLPHDAVVAFSSSINYNDPFLPYFLEQPVLRVPNVDLRQLAEQRPVFFAFYTRDPDDLVDAARGAGAVLHIRTEHYSV
ncbi:MAG: hypothetical protein ACKV2O_01680, partial [Acidimicrobiales bacterium]